MNELSVEELRAIEEWGKRIRREKANWEFIRKLPSRLRKALEYYVETGDLYVASRIAGLRIEEFNELRIKAGVPST